MPALWTPDGRGAGDPAGLVDDAWSRHAELSAHLSACAPRMEALAMRNFEVLDKLLALP